jgi:hypothetical protein
MKKYLLSVVLFFVVSDVFCQTRFKLLADAGIGTESDNFYATNSGLIIERKIDINKSIETGIYSHQLEQFLNKDEGFYEAFVQGTDNARFYNDITHFKLSFNFVTIPLGYNHYLSPKTYIGYKIGFNFLTNLSYAGVFSDTGDGSDGEDIFKAHLDKSHLNKFYYNHTLTINHIFLRRFDVGIGSIFTPKSAFVRNDAPENFKSFNKTISKYATISVHFKIYIFQIKSRSL